MELRRVLRDWHPRLSGGIAVLCVRGSYSLPPYAADLLGRHCRSTGPRVLASRLSPCDLGLCIVAPSLSRTLERFPCAVSAVLFATAAGRSMGEVVPLTDRVVRLSLT